MVTQYCVSRLLSLSPYLIAHSPAQSQECQKAHWASHKPICQHTSSATLSAKQQLMDTGVSEDVVRGLMSVRNRTGVCHDLDKILLLVVDNRLNKVLYYPLCIGYQYCHVNNLRPIVEVVLEYQNILQDV